jgi:DNA repair exonuclease SbcCD nuclease subunit
LKFLLVGDVHAVPDELDDCQALLDFVYSKSSKNIGVVFMGDQHHTFNVVRAEVLDFWHRNLKKFKESGIKTYMLVGNHDRTPNTSSGIHSLMYGDVCEVISEPTRIDNVAFVPWQHSVEAFVQEAKWVGGDYLVCHQTIVGAKYENGFYVPEDEGVNLSDLEDWKKIFSGHIHSPQTFKNVEYVGAPRWRISTDSDVCRRIVLFDPSNGSVERFSTEGVCRAMYSYSEHETGASEPIQVMVRPYKLALSLHGSADYIESRKRVWQELNSSDVTVSIRSFQTRPREVQISESEGVGKAFNKYVTAYKPKFNSNPEVLRKIIFERVKI